MTVPVLQVKNLYKLFIPLEHSQNEKKAMAMLEQGASRTEVQEATGITAGLIDINFTVNKGEVFVLIGLSGSGKSTLIHCLNMLNPPTSGTVYLEGDNITDFSSKQLQELRRTKVAMVFQNFGLISNRNVLENTYYGLEIRGVPLKERTEKAMQMLEMVGLQGWEKNSHQCAFRRYEATRRHRPRTCQRSRYPADGRSIFRARPLGTQRFTVRAVAYSGKNR